MRILLLVSMFLLMLPTHIFSQCSDLFFSEYIEGLSNNKAIEFYNPTSATVNLSDYVLYRYNNGSPTPTDSLFPQGTLAPGNVYVAGNPSAVAGILSVSDTLHTITFFNGDDALSLKKISTNTILDVIGLIGNDPGTNWPVGTGATSEFTLIRMVGVQQGNTNWAVAATEYDVYPQNTITFLGSHSMTSCCASVVTTLSSQTNVLCSGDSTGSVVVNASGGITFTYDWLVLGNTSATVTGLAAGTYTVVVTNECSNTDTLVVTITQPLFPVIMQLDTATEASCNLSNGSLTVLTMGGTPGYSYSWTSGDLTATASNLAAGIYTCTVTDANGCTDVESFSVQNPNPPTVTVSLSDDTLCQSLGAFMLTGHSPFGGVWTGNGVIDSTFDTNAASLGWNIITYTYTDSSNCVGSAIDSLFVDLCLGISNTDNNLFEISPNPFTSEIFMSFPNPFEKVISLYNTNGELVYQEKINIETTRITLDYLPAGIYLLQVASGSEVKTKKIQKSE